MKLIDMKLSPEKQSEMKSEATIGGGDQDQYPYGLQIRLGKDELEKLGIKNLPSPNQVAVLTAQVEVTSVSSYDTQQGEDKSISLQITDLSLSAFGEEAEEKENPADVLYPSKGE